MQERGDCLAEMLGEFPAFAGPTNCCVDKYFSLGTVLEQKIIGLLRETSPSLFVICLEPLLIRLLLDEEIERVRTNEGDLLEVSVAYADDDTTLVKNSKENLDRVTNIFNEFEMISGLSLNKKKPLSYHWDPQ